MDVKCRPSWVQVPAFHLERKPQCLASDAHEDRVDEASGNGHRLQCLQSHLASSHKKGGGSQTLGQCPKKSLESWWVWMPVAGEAVDDKAARVTAGDKVENKRDEREYGKEGTEVAIAHHHVKPHLFGLSAGESGEVPVHCCHPPPVGLVQLYHLLLPRLVGDVAQPFQKTL